MPHLSKFFFRVHGVDYDAFHAAAPRRLNPGRRIFKNQTVPGRNSQFVEPPSKNTSGSGFSTLNLVATDQSLKVDAPGACRPSRVKSILGAIARRRHRHRQVLGARRFE